MVHSVSRLTVAVAVLASGFVAGSTYAGIKLITLPDRQRLEIQLDNPNATLVEEERVVPLAAGVNDVVFAWANTNIDKDSLQLRCLEDADQVKVLSMTYPPNENALTWQVSSPTATAVRVRISYIIGGLTKSYLYRAVASHDEKTLSLWQYMDLHNNANESFGDAGMWTGTGERIERPILANETKEVLAARFQNVPIRKTYTADLALNGYLDEGKKQIRIPMHYVITNSKANQLGEFALMPGKARMFIDDGANGEAFLGEDLAPFTPKDDKVRLFLGVAKDIVVKRTIERREETVVVGPVKNYEVTVKYEIENFKDQPVTLDLAENMQALRQEISGRNCDRNVEWAFGEGGSLIEPVADESTADRPRFKVDLPARGKDQKAIKIIKTLSVVIKNEW